MYRKKYTLLLKISVMLLFFIVATRPVSAETTCVNVEELKKAASFSNTSSCLYQKYFFAKDALGDYRIFTLRSDNKIVRYVRMCGLVKCYSPIYSSTNNSSYYCTGANTPVLINNETEDWNQVKSVARMTSNYPSIIVSNSYTANEESFLQTDYSNWLKSHSGADKYCPTNVVVSYVDAYLNSTIFAGDRSASVEMATSYSDAVSKYNSTVSAAISNHSYSSADVAASTLQKDLSDFLGPRKYLDKKSEILLADILPLVKINGSSDLAKFSSSEAVSEDRQMTSIFQILNGYEQELSGTSSIDCSKLSSPEAVANNENAKNLNDKMLPTFYAAKVKLANAELRGFGNSFSASSYPGYDSLSKKMNDYINKQIDELSGKAIDFSPVAKMCYLNNKKIVADLQAQDTECQQKLAEHPNDTTLQAQCINIRQRLLAAQSAIHNYDASFEKITSSEPIDCESFGDTLMGIFKIFMIIAPILVIVLGTVDFAKATLASDESALKKAGSNFAKRVIAAVILFLLPMIVNIVLGIGYQVGILKDQPQTCIVEEQNK